MYCVKCGKPLTGNDRFCRYCGTSAATTAAAVEEQKPRFCTACGAQLAPSQRICTKCGLLNKENPSSTTVNDILKTYDRLSYTADPIEFTNVIDAIFVLNRDRLNLYNIGPRNTLMFASPLLLTVCIASARNAKNAGKASVSILYKDITQLIPGTHDNKKTIAVQLNNGGVYVLLVGKHQQEILDLIRSNM